MTSLVGNAKLRLQLEKESYDETQKTWLPVDPALIAESNRIREKLIALAKEAAHLELSFWRKVIRSRKTSSSELRRAAHNMHLLHKDLNLPKEEIAADTLVFQKEALRRAWLRLIKRKKEHDYHVPETVQNIRTRMHRLGMKLSDLGTTEDELNSLAKRPKGHYARPWRRKSHLQEVE